MFYYLQKATCIPTEPINDLLSSKDPSKAYKRPNNVKHLLMTGLLSTGHRSSINKKTHKRYPVIGVLSTEEDQSKVFHLRKRVKVHLYSYKTSQKIFIQRRRIKGFEYKNTLLRSPILRRPIRVFLETENWSKLLYLSEMVSIFKWQVKDF